MIVGRHHFEDMVAHARQEVPNECCGVLAGQGHIVQAVYPVANAFASPTRYRLAPLELCRVLEEMGQKGWQVVGFYHSHVFSEAFPSVTDLKMAFWRDYLCVIISLEDNERPVVRVFHIVEGNAVEEPVEIVTS
jgi:proteasome lid subunit RPN8/RPN11